MVVRAAPYSASVTSPDQLVNCPASRLRDDVILALLRGWRERRASRVIRRQRLDSDIEFRFLKAPVTTGRQLYARQERVTGRAAGAALPNCVRSGAV